MVLVEKQNKKTVLPKVSGKLVNKWDFTSCFYLLISGDIATRKSVKSSKVDEKAKKHRLKRLQIFCFPYTIRLISLNLLLLPSTNPEFIS